MSRINVTPLKEVNGIKFGSSKEDVRSKFDKQSKRHTTTYKENCLMDVFDDSWMVFYNESGNAIAVAFDSSSEIYNGKKKIFPTSIRESSNNLNTDFTRKRGDYISENTCTRIKIPVSKMEKITFFENKNVMKSFPETFSIPKKDSKYMKESIGDIMDPEAFEKEKRERTASLTDTYDNLKSQLDSDPNETPMINPMNNYDANRWMDKARTQSNQLRNDAHKHILLDIYCNIIPLDKSYVDGNQGEMKSDIDAMLASKNMTPTQYLKSCYDATKAPLLEFVLRAGDIIARTFLEDAKETLDKAKEEDMSLPEPEADINTDGVQDQLVDVKQDGEYETFIDELKKKTINKIVDDVSKIITDKKEEQNMTFDPKPVGDEVMAAESAVSVGLNYLNQEIIRENVDIAPELEEEMIGMAIREATLNVMDTVFNQPGSDFRSFFNRVRLGEGAIINNKAKKYFIEAAEQNKRYEPLYKEVDGNKYDVSNYEKVDDKGNKTPMSDQEAKKVLDPDGYKGYQNRNRS